HLSGALMRPIFLAHGKQRAWTDMGSAGSMPSQVAARYPLDARASNPRQADCGPSRKAEHQRSAPTIAKDQDSACSCSAYAMAARIAATCAALHCSAVARGLSG